MQREEKQLDMFLENSLIKLNDLKKAIAQMIHKIGKLICLRLVQQFEILFFAEFEHEIINWPAFLDNFALISGHVSSLTNSSRVSEVKFKISNFSLLDYPSNWRWSTRHR